MQSSEEIYRLWMVTRSSSSFDIQGSSLSPHVVNAQIMSMFSNSKEEASVSLEAYCSSEEWHGHQHISIGKGQTSAPNRRVVQSTLPWTSVFSVFSSINWILPVFVSAAQVEPEFKVRLPFRSSVSHFLVSRLSIYHMIFCQ